MKNLLLIFTVSAAGAALFAQGPPPGPRGFEMGPRGMGLGLGMGHQVVTGHPYSGTETLQIVQTLANGNTITHQNTAQVYRDSEGRTRVETTRTPPPGSNGTPFTEIIISDPVSGHRYMLNSATLVAIDTPLPKPRTGNSTSATNRPAPPARPGVTVATTDLGSRTLNGITQTGKQVTETIAAGAIGNAAAITITRTSWVATDLQVPVSIQSSDPRFGTSDFELTNISTAEPAASLFQVPSNYTVQTGGAGRGFGRGAAAGFRPPPPQQ